MIEQRFGESEPFSVGVEEELMILDATTLALTPAVSTLLAGAAGRDLPGTLKTELHASVVELTTGVCGSPHQALAELRALRVAAIEIAGERGLEVAAGGSHPFSPPEQQEIAAEERYADFVAYAGVTARRQGVSGLHVHVGMPGSEECLHALEGVLPWLPVLLALSANSPYLEGAETGHLSIRAEILGLLPRRGAPPAFASFGAWERFVSLFQRVGLIAEYTQLWWDVRPHPRFGTLEIRATDQPTSLDLSGAFVALLQALCVTALGRPRRPPDPAGRGVYDQNRWAALHRGPRAELIHPDRDSLVPVPELAAELLEQVAPAAAELGTSELLARLDPASCEGDRQLEIGRERGLEAVCSDLVARSVP
ncbi:MAG: YbdK family carboxylate-amine ligase [Gaiellaceae bacterium]